MANILRRLDSWAEKHIFVPLLELLCRFTGLSNSWLARFCAYTGVACLDSSALHIFLGHRGFSALEITTAPMITLVVVILLEMWQIVGEGMRNAIIFLRVIFLIGSPAWVPQLFDGTAASITGSCGQFLVITGFYFLTNDRPKQPGWVGQTLAALLAGPRTKPQTA